MQVVYLADNLFDAHLVKHALEDAGIPAFVFGESLMGGMGELPLFGVLRVGVPDSVWPEAKELVSGLSNGHAEAEPTDASDEDEDGWPSPA